MAIILLLCNWRYCKVLFTGNWHIYWKALQFFSCQSLALVFHANSVSQISIRTEKYISIVFCSVDGSILGLVFEDSKVKVWNLSEKKFAELKTSQAPTSITVVEVSSSAYIGTKEGLHYQHSVFWGLSHVFIAYLKLPLFCQCWDNSR